MLGIPCNGDFKTWGNQKITKIKPFIDKYN